MESRTKLGIFFALFIGVIVAIALLPDIASNVQQMTNRISVINETVDISVARLASGSINNTYNFTVTNEPDGWRTTECPLTNFLYGNDTADWTSATDYVVALDSGTFTLENTVAVNGTVGGNSNTTYVDYDYCTTGYITNSGGRSMARLILILAAIGLIGFAIYYGVKDLI
jgi:hypothetical protein